MGMDVAFNRGQALAAGLVTRTERRGTDQQIRMAKHVIERGDVDQPDQDYLDYLEEITTDIQVPDAGHWVEDDGAGEHIVVRANKWGRTYAPLTQWLRANNISWTEI